MEEAQTGALVLLVDDGQGHVTEAVGVPVMRDGQPYRLQFWAYGLVAMEAAWTDGSAFEVTYHDHRYDWQILAARVDRQFWHGGVYNETMGFLNANMDSAGEGETAYLSPVIASSVYPSASYALTTDGVSPLTGIMRDGRVALSYNGQLSGQTVFMPVPLVPQPNLNLIRAVLMRDADSHYYLQLLYPSYSDPEEMMFYLLDDNGEYAQSGALSPAYISEV